MKSGFTFIELILVLAIIGLMFSLVGYQTGSFTFWREEGFIRKFSEQARFLYSQSVSDQATYQLEIDVSRNTYRIGVLKDELGDDPILDQLRATLGGLSLELAALLNPPQITGQTVIASPSFPSLFEEMSPPNGMSFIQVKTPGGVISQASRGDSNGKAYLYFTPNGSSDFGVIKLQQAEGQVVTLVVNPFTGLIDIYRDGRDVSWEAVADAS